MAGVKTKQNSYTQKKKKTDRKRLQKREFEMLRPHNMGMTGKM